MREWSQAHGVSVLREGHAALSCDNRQENDAVVGCRGGGLRDTSLEPVRSVAVIHAYPSHQFQSKTTKYEQVGEPSHTSTRFFPQLHFLDREAGK